MRVEELLERLRKEFVKVNLLQAALDSVIFFLVANLVMFTFQISLVGGVKNFYTLSVVTLLVFTIDLFYRYRTYDLELYEEQNPELREKLRTARDNLDSQNIVSQALFDEVMDTARKVTSESIIPSRRIIQKIILIGGLSFLTVFSGLMNVQLGGQGSQLLEENSLQDLIPTDGEEDDFQLLNSTEIYGEQKKIDLETLNTEFEIQGEDNDTEDELNYDSEPEEFQPEVADSQLEDDMEIAKEYMLRIRE